MARQVVWSDQRPWTKRYVFDPFWWARLLPMTGLQRFDLRRWITRRSYLADLRKMRAAKATSVEIQGVQESMRWELDMLEEEEDQFISDRLKNVARKRRLPLPPVYVGDGSGRELSSYYERTGPSGFLVLSYEGRGFIQSAVREEERYRSDKRARAIPWMTSFAALVSAVSAATTVYVTVTKDDGQKPSASIVATKAAAPVKSVAPASGARNP